MQNLAPYSEIYFDPLFTHEGFYCILMAEMLLPKSSGHKQSEKEPCFH